MLYFLSLGTNIEPKTNAVLMVKALIEKFGDAVVFPFVETSPVDIKSRHQFLNSICVVNADMPEPALKAITNQIEIDMGRDRSHPLSSSKDRPADIDIMLQAAHAIDENELLSDEAYINAVITSRPNARVDLTQFGLPAINRPTAVNLDTDSGQIVVIENKINCFNQALKAAL